MRWVQLLCAAACVLGACADDPRPKVYRQCPDLPNQMAPDEVVLINISTTPDRTLAATLTASVTAAGGVMEAYPSAVDSAFSASVDRIGARVVCDHEAVLFASEPRLVVPTE